MASFVAGACLIVATMFFVTLPAVSYADALTRQLDIGMSGTDVSALQTFLAQDATLYPQGLVTGYFGVLTSAAVSNFQTRNGIDSVGRVGPITLPILNVQMANGMASSLSAPYISSVFVSTSRNNANVSWNTNEFAKGVVYYSSSPLVTYEHTNSVDVSGNSAMTDTNFKSSQDVSLQNLQPNTTYYYLIYTTDQKGNVSVTWPGTFQTTN
jgi:peptidoglycan hydrolase-like protein with peptidoglycan-binding domain